MEKQKSKRTSLLRIPAIQTIAASLLCVLAGLLIGYIVLLLINPNGATEALGTIISNFMSFKKATKQISNFGNTLVKTVPLLMCSLSVLFSVSDCFSPMD